jgi:putative tryptophan/tyrosine transport system substrate-binding protein
MAPDRMRQTRRHFLRGSLVIAGLGLLAGCGAVPWERPAGIPTIGLLALSLDPERTGFIESLKEGLRDLGYVEGRTLTVDTRHAEGDMSRLPALTKDLVARKVALIVASGIPEVEAAASVTRTIPIVMMNVADPVALGLVESLGRPGGNLTGLTNLSRQIVPKGLELLREIMPGLGRLAVIYNPSSAAKRVELAELRAAAEGLRVEIVPFEVRASDEVGRALEAAVRDRVGALSVFNDSVTRGQLPQIARFAQGNHLPAISVLRALPESGGLMAYGASVGDQWRRGATYVDKILKGAKPADLPIQQPTTFELVVNLKTAKVLGLTIPRSVLQQATEIIE